MAPKIKGYKGNLGHDPGFSPRIGEEKMLTIALFRAIPAVTLASMLVAQAASAEERCKVSIEFGNEETTFPQQLRLDVGDIPGHRIAVFEIHHGPNPNAKPNCEGFKVTDQSAHGIRCLVLAFAGAD
jgi:hypothetical protein